LTPHAAVVCEKDRALSCATFLPDEENYRFSFNVDGTEIFAVARSSVALAEIVDIVCCLLVANARDVNIINLRNVGRNDEGISNAPSLAYLMKHRQSLMALTLQKIPLDENHCRVLGAWSRPGLEIELKLYKITSAGSCVLAEILGRNQGPTSLDSCDIDKLVLADGLRGNSRLKSLSVRLSNRSEDENQTLKAIAGALKENKGLVDLKLRYLIRVSDEAWDAICNSLKTHPTLQVLELISRFPDNTMTPAMLKSRIQALDMLKLQTSIHTIRFRDRYSEHELFRGSVIPYLETNRLRPRLLAIQKTRPIAYRAKVLGRALLAVRTDVNRFWMLLSGNAEVAFPSTSVTTTIVTNLPTPATVGATFTANAAPVVAGAASPTAASNVIVPSAGQKRKTCQ
jgi:hypothetical protein